MCHEVGVPVGTSGGYAQKQMDTCVDTQKKKDLLSIFFRVPRE